jgi:general stress protein 26
MAKEQLQSEKSPIELADRVWDLAKKTDFCMFNTWDGSRIRSRPLSARVRHEEDAIYFLVDVLGAKNAQIEEFPEVTLSFADTHAHHYVTITGSATVTDNRAKIRDLWSKFDRAWWEDENDPDIRLITVRPHEAELWDSPNRLVAAAVMLAAAVTGAQLPTGDNAKVRL